MFLGRYAHTFDDKGRIAVPTRFRDLLNDGAYLTQGFDKNLMVWRVVDFEKIYEQVNGMSITDPNARQFMWMWTRWEESWCRNTCVRQSKSLAAPWSSESGTILKSGPRIYGMPKTIKFMIARPTRSVLQR
jgi:hypothetical protein